MCHYRGTYTSEAGQSTEADRRRELAAKRGETIDRLLHEAGSPARQPVADPAPAKEAVPAK